MYSKEFQMEIPYKIVKSKAQIPPNKQETTLKELSYTMYMACHNHVLVKKYKFKSDFIDLSYHLFNSRIEFH